MSVLRALAVVALAASALAQEPEQWRCGVCRLFATRLTHHLDAHEGVNRGASWNKYSQKRSAVDLLVQVEGALEKGTEDVTSELLLDGKKPDGHIRRAMWNWAQRVAEEQEDDLIRVMKREAKKEPTKGQSFDLSNWLCNGVLEVCPTPEGTKALPVAMAPRREGDPRRTRDEYDL
eukprot:TRINITY_DN30465_c0_g1_i1.p2 TRINITY_DN30465_c0_g1~~TRINITY_DN30465_c0_g1_i1.p2  ORF type:complete len:176 (+),score=56.70 TRINITY_DN30465_c0_g1_i1:50-577(+)